MQALNVDVMAELAEKTHIPIATGERIFTKWGFKEILEKRAAHILQPDVCYAGGITELKIIAGMAEAYYSPLAPHNPQGPCSLAASLQIAAAIPNFLTQEGGGNEYEDLLAKPLPPVANGHRPLPTGHRHRRRQADGSSRRTASLSSSLRPGRRVGRGLVGRRGRPPPHGHVLTHEGAYADGMRLRASRFRAALLLVGCCSSVS